MPRRPRGVLFAGLIALIIGILGEEAPARQTSPTDRATSVASVRQKVERLGFPMITNDDR